MGWEVEEDVCGWRREGKGREIEKRGGGEGRWGKEEDGGEGVGKGKGREKEEGGRRRKRGGIGVGRGGRGKEERAVREKGTGRRVLKGEEGGSVLEL